MWRTYWYFIDLLFHRFETNVFAPHCNFEYHYKFGREEPVNLTLINILLIVAEDSISKTEL